MRYGEIIGAIGGSIAIFRSVWDGARWWRNRGKIEISVLRVIYHAVRYAEGTGYLRGHDGRPGGYIDTSTALDGRVKNAFTVLEFEIRSTHKQPVTVGMIAIEDWIFSERYHKHMYGPYQDYRVFDLYTRAPASLAPYHKLEAWPKSGNWLVPVV